MRGRVTIPVAGHGTESPESQSRYTVQAHPLDALPTRRTYDTFQSIVTADKARVHACLNLDAKTLSMRPDLYMYFGEEEAAWKAQLLRFHRSQHERNLKTRGHGFDERVLKLNRESAAKEGGPMPYAEIFELRAFGCQATSA
jgi:hypothetical protein